MHVSVKHRFNDSVTISRGPLVYGLKIGQRWNKIRGELPHADFEVLPTTPWNYALDIDLNNPEQSVTFVKKKMNGVIFSSDGARWNCTSRESCCRNGSWSTTLPACCPKVR